MTLFVSFLVIYAAVIAVQLFCSSAFVRRPLRSFRPRSRWRMAASWVQESGPEIRNFRRGVTFMVDLPIRDRSTWYQVDLRRDQQDG